MPSVGSAPPRRGAQGRTAREAPLTPRFLIRMLGEAFHGPAWHGPALLPALHGCTPADAERRLAPGRNTIHELVLHAAYGKHIVRGRLTSDPRRFGRPLTRPWWPRVVDPSAAGWHDDLALLDSANSALVDALDHTTPVRLARRRPGKQRTLGEEVLGIVLHDTYHAGQIALLRKLAGS